MAGKKGKKDDSKSSDENHLQQVEMAAYFRWLKRGCPIGDEMEDWVGAEKEISDKLKAAKNN
jgi:hypothetical protein